MATYTVELNNWSEFDSQYPIILQNLVTPQEFNDIISHCNRYASKIKSAQRTNVIVIFSSMIILFVAISVGIIVPTINFTRSSFPFIFIFPFAIFIIYMIIIFAIIFRFRKKMQKFKEGIRSYLNQENQNKFIERGVQFLLKERAVPGRKSFSMVPYIEIVVAPQNMYQHQPTYQQPVQQPPTYQHTYQQPPTYQQPTYQQQEYQPTPYIAPHMYVSPYSSMQPNQHAQSGQTQL